MPKKLFEEEKGSPQVNLNNMEDTDDDIATQLLQMKIDFEKMNNSRHHMSLLGDLESFRKDEHGHSSSRQNTDRKDLVKTDTYNVIAKISENFESYN